MSRTKNFDEMEVLHKILLLFRQKGYRQASLEDILRSGGISKQSMYDTYGDKRQVFLKAFRLYREENVKALFDLVQEELNKEVPAIDILRTMIFPGKTPCETVKGCLMINTMIELKEKDDEISVEINKLLLSLAEIIRLLVKRGQMNGEITDRLPVDHITEVLLNARNGIQVNQHYEMPLDMMHNIANWTIDLIRVK
jgi:TetR/AcrR family transcriptional repressor of nem operon